MTCRNRTPHALIRQFRESVAGIELRSRRHVLRDLLQRNWQYDDASALVPQNQTITFLADVRANPEIGWPYLLDCLQLLLRLSKALRFRRRDCLNHD